MDKQLPNQATLNPINSAVNAANKKPWIRWVFKGILTFLILLVLLEIIALAKAFFAANPKLKKPNPVSGGEIALIANKTTYKVGEVVPVIIRVSTGGFTSVGADVNFSFDPNFFQASSSASFARGRIYDEFPIILVDSTTGITKLSAITAAGKRGFSGVGVFGGLFLTAKKVGKTSINLDFTPGSTTDSTISEVRTARSILSKVDNLNLAIVDQNTPTPSISPKDMSCHVRTYQLCTDSQGRMGSQWCSNIEDNPLFCRSGCYQDQYGFVPGCKIIVAPTQKSG